MKVNPFVEEKLDWSDKLFKLLTVYWKKIIAVAISIVVVIITMLLVFYYVDQKKESAAELFYKALQTEKIDEKAEILKRIENEYSWLRVSELAKFYHVEESIKNKDYEKALSLISELQKNLKDPFLKVGLYYLLAKLESDRGNLEKVLGAYDEASRVQGNLLKDESQFLKARTLENMKRYDEAKILYEELLGRLEDDIILKNRCEERLIWLSTRKD